MKYFGAVQIATGVLSPGTNHCHKAIDLPPVFVISCLEVLGSILFGVRLGKRAGRGALRLFKRPARFCRGGVWFVSDECVLGLLQS